MRKRALTAVLSAVILALGGIELAAAVTGDVAIPVPSEVFTSADGREITVPARTITSNVTLPDPPPVTVTETVTQTVTVTTGGGSGEASYGAMVALHFPAPEFTPTRTVDVASGTQLNTAWANLQPGDRINAHDFTVTSWFKLQNKNLADWAEIRFENVNFLNGVEIENVSKIRFYGGDITSSTVHGIRAFGNTDLTWRDFYVHDCAGTGLAVLPTNPGYPGYKPPTRNEFVGEITNCGRAVVDNTNPNLDPHSEKGTGLHGAYIGASGNAHKVIGLRLALDIHDQPTGAGIQWTNSDGGLVVLRAQRLTRRSTSQTAANAIQLFGSPVTNLTVKYLEAADLQGNAVDVSDFYAAGALSTNTVEYGRAENYGLNPTINGGFAWDSWGGINYQDVQPQDFGDD